MRNSLKSQPGCQALARVPAARAREAGFTLVELLFAILILLVGIVSVAELVPAALRSNFRNRNDSTGLIAAQRQLAQMAEQPMTVLGANCGGGGPAPAGHYYFCDQDGDVIAVGRNAFGTGLTGVNVLADGCPVDATGQQLDFTQPMGACTGGAGGGYTVTKQWVWNPTTGTMQKVEVRWRVVTVFTATTPVRKVFIVGARSGAAGQGFVITNLQTMVGP